MLLLSTLSLLALTLISCSDHVTEAEDTLAEYQTIEKIKSNAQLKTKLKFSSETLGSKLDEIELSLSSTQGDLNQNTFIAQFWHEKDSELELLKQETFVKDPSASSKLTLSIDHESGLSDTSLITYIDAITIQVKGNQDSFFATKIPRTLMEQNHQIFQTAKDQYTDNNKSILGSIVHVLKQASQHLNLANAGNHEKHLRHVAQSLYGREGRNPQWADDAPINNVDTSSITAKLNFLKLYLVAQAQWNDTDAQVYFTELSLEISTFNDSLSIEMDQLEDSFDREPDQASIQTNKVLLLIEPFIPTIEYLIENVNGKLVKTTSQGQ